MVMVMLQGGAYMCLHMCLQRQLTRLSVTCISRHSMNSQAQAEAVSERVMIAKAKQLKI
jgi:hypothetical protein